MEHISLKGFIFFSSELSEICKVQVKLTILRRLLNNGRKLSDQMKEKKCFGRANGLIQRSKCSSKGPKARSYGHHPQDHLGDHLNDPLSHMNTCVPMLGHFCYIYSFGTVFFLNLNSGLLGPFHKPIARSYEALN